MQVSAVKSYRQDSPHQADRGGTMRGEQETSENVWSRAAGASIAFLLFGLMPRTAWAESYGVTVEHNATAVMREGTKWSLRTCAGAFNRKAIGIRSRTNRKTDTTRWNGRPSCRTRMARWECLAARMWEQRSILRPSQSHRTLRAFAPMSPRRIITMAGRTRAARLNNGLPNHGARDWQ